MHLHARAMVPPISATGCLHCDRHGESSVDGLHRSKTDYALFFRIWKIGVLWHVLLAESLKDAILIEGKVLHAALGVEAAHTPDLAALDVGTETMAVEARGRAATHGLGGNVIREVVHDVYDAKFIRLVSSQA